MNLVMCVRIYGYIQHADCLILGSIIFLNIINYINIAWKLQKKQKKKEMVMTESEGEKSKMEAAGR